MREMLEQKLARFEQLEEAMSDPEVLSNSAKMASIAREHGSLVKLVMRYRGFRKLSLEVSEVRELALSEDPEERELAAAELPELLGESRVGLERVAGIDDRR